MNYDEIEKSIIQEFKLIASKKPHELTKADWQKFWLWSENTELCEFLPLGDSARSLLKKLPQLEIQLIKSPIDHFSKWYVEAEGKREFQRTQFIDDVINIYKKCLEGRCVNKEAELIRLKLTKEYKKCIAAFDKIKPEEKVSDEQKKHDNAQSMINAIKPKHLVKYKRILYHLKIKSNWNLESIAKSLEMSDRNLDTWIRKMKIDFGFKTRENNEKIVEFATDNGLI